MASDLTQSVPRSSESLLGLGSRPQGLPTFWDKSSPWQKSAEATAGGQ